MAGNQQVLGEPPSPNIPANASAVRPPWPPKTSVDASSLVPAPAPARQNYTLPVPTDAPNNVDDVDRNASLVNETLVSVNDNAPVSAPDTLPLPPPPSPNVATPSPQPDPSPAVPPPSPPVSPPPPRSPVLPPPPPANQTPPPPPPPNKLPPPPTSKISPSPPPPHPVILSPPPPVSPPPPPTTVAPPSLHVPPSPSPRLPPDNSSAPSSNSSTPTIPTPVRPSPSIHRPGRDQPTDSPNATPSSRHSRDSSSSSTSHDSSSSGGNFPVAAAVGGSVAAVVALALLALVLFIMKKRKNSSNIEYKPPPNTMATNPDVSSAESSYGLLAYRPGMPDSGVSKSRFTYEELKDITAGFSQENLLGQGGFGCVYRGRLPDGRTVAVKQLKVGGGQGEREFRAEVEIISRVHHRHLVSLVGYCISENNQLLVYEYVPNKTLEHHLHAKGLPVMEWSKRVKIAIGSARGLAYLHEDCHPRIIHRDIKSANILLDDCFEAQVADFGLAKLTNDTNTHVSTRVMGTFGYMAPEYASSGKLTDRSDVFSFGVVLLELITGRKPVDESQPLEKRV